jgi:hypothetical protein
MARAAGFASLLALAIGAGLLGPAPGRAEVATDGTLGAKVRLTGRDVQIPARLGQVRGKNLFHSFARFGIDTSGKVTFTGPDGLKNVIGRVTGGERSTIDGTLAPISGCSTRPVSCSARTPGWRRVRASTIPVTAPTRRYRRWTWSRPRRSLNWPIEDCRTRLEARP